MRPHSAAHEHLQLVPRHLGAHPWDDAESLREPQPEGREHLGGRSAWGFEWALPVPRRET